MLEGATDMVALTDRAQDTLRRLIANAEAGTNGLRIMVDPGGCAGLQYTLGLETAACDGDRVYAFEHYLEKLDASRDG